MIEIAKPISNQLAWLRGEIDPKYNFEQIDLKNYNALSFKDSEGGSPLIEYESDLDSSEITLYNENLVLGAKIGIKILKNVSLLLNVENLYYDNNFDGITDKNGTNGLEIKYDF